jgi:hypothetical protein
MENKKVFLLHYVDMKCEKAKQIKKMYGILKNKYVCLVY